MGPVKIERSRNHLTSRAGPRLVSESLPKESVFATQRYDRDGSSCWMPLRRAPPLHGKPPVFCRAFLQPGVEYVHAKGFAALGVGCGHGWPVVGCIGNL